MQSGTSVLTRFVSSRLLGPQGSLASPVQIDDIHIESIPSDNRGQSAILRFRLHHKSASDLEKAQLAGISEAESQMWLAFIGFTGRTNIRYQGTLADGQDTRIGRLHYSYLETPPIDFSRVSQIYDKLAQLRKNDRSRYVNAIQAFQTAVALLDSNPTLSFFLSVVAIECLSNYVNLPGTKGPRDRFVKFVSKYLHTEMSSEKSDLTRFEQAFDTAYRIRSSFVHSGQQLPNPVRLADAFGVRAVTYPDRGKRRLAPSLIYLHKIVGATLEGFLEARIVEKPNRPRKPVFRPLARKILVGKLTLKQGVSVKKGEPVTRDMIDVW